jgi:hypothetical protein
MVWAMKDGKPFFVRLNPTRIHIVTHLSPKYEAMRNAENGWSEEEAGMAQLIWRESARPYCMTSFPVPRPWRYWSTRVIRRDNPSRLTLKMLRVGLISNLWF